MLNPDSVKKDMPPRIKQVDVVPMDGQPPGTMVLRGHEAEVSDSLYNYLCKRIDAHVHFSPGVRRAMEPGDHESHRLWVSLSSSIRLTTVKVVSFGTRLPVDSLH